jgi:ABC-type uncharacterized transport system fused permease/ATPase subunit
MWITHRVGRALVPINFDRLRFEADFRYGLTPFPRQRGGGRAVAGRRGGAQRRAGTAAGRHLGTGGS